MPIAMNLNPGGLFSVPGGYPLRLIGARDLTLSGVIGNAVSSVSAVVQTESGTANVHLGLFKMPSTSGGNDGAVVAQTDLTGLTMTQATITVSVPSGAVPACYVVRLWADSITGSNADTISRDGTTASANEPKIPTAVIVQSVTVS